MVELTVRDLPDDIKRDWISNSKNMERSRKISEYVNLKTIISPAMESQEIKIEEDVSFNLYQLIEEKVDVLTKEGLSQEDINQYILTDIHLNVRSF